MTLLIGLLGLMALLIGLLGLMTLLIGLLGLMALLIGLLGLMTLLIGLLGLMTLLIGEASVPSGSPEGKRGRPQSRWTIAWAARQGGRGRRSGMGAQAVEGARAVEVAPSRAGSVPPARGKIQSQPRGGAAPQHSPWHYQEDFASGRRGRDRHARGQACVRARGGGDVGGSGRGVVE